MNRNVRFREADLGRVSMKLRWSLGKRRIEKGYLSMVWTWIFIDTSVNFDVYHRLTRRRLGVDFSFTSGVRVRTTTTCTPSATIRTSRRTIVVQRHGRRRTVLSVCNKVTNDDRTVFSLWFLQTIELSTNQKTNKMLPSYIFRKTLNVVLNGPS